MEKVKKLLAEADAALAETRHEITQSPERRALVALSKAVRALAKLPAPEPENPAPAKAAKA